MSKLISRNVTVDGRRTSIRLEHHMWESLNEISEREKITVHELVTALYLRLSPEMTLTASVRVFIMLYYKAAATETGHVRVGHGKLKSKLKQIPKNPAKIELLNSNSYKDF